MCAGIYRRQRNNEALCFVISSFNLRETTQMAVKCTFAIQQSDTKSHPNWTIRELCLRRNALIQGENMSLSLFSLIHDVRLWNVCLLKQRFLFQGEFMTLLITKLLDDRAQRSWQQEQQHNVWSWRFPKCLTTEVTIAAYSFSTNPAFIPKLQIISCWMWMVVSEKASVCDFRWLFFLLMVTLITDRWAKKKKVMSFSFFFLLYNHEAYRQRIKMFFFLHHSHTRNTRLGAQWVSTISHPSEAWTFPQLWCKTLICRKLVDIFLAL